jgi:light-regulated signal transduction histidine kinase (bacteriophytochrome)
MLVDRFNVEKFGEVFPHMENILHCGLYIYSFQQNETHWSRGMYSILGVEPDSIEPSFENFSKYILAEDRDRVRTTVNRAREKRLPYNIDFSMLDGRGIYKRIHAETHIKSDEAGSAQEYSGVIKDITESYFYKKALEQKVMQLDKSNKNLQEFVYVASHDLQEPLRKISTFVERLKSRFETVLGQEGNMYVGRILNSSVNMQTLLEDLLNFSRLSVNDKEFEKVSLQDCMNSVLNDLEIKIEETGTKVTVDPLPEIQAYATQVKQLFSNLLSNAIKFRRPGVPPVVTITSKPVKQEEYPEYTFTSGLNYIQIRVEDNGIGFEQEFSDRIFMIFQRLNGKTEFAGSGIGLSICKKIVENHHGFIFASGMPDKGAIFTVLLPEKQY